jgi:exopolysaccharide biosynthesis polyprenyl glycosylphosphotransferase
MRRRISGVATDAMLQIADLAALAAALPIAHGLYGLWKGGAPVPTLAWYWPQLVAALVIWAASARLNGLYEERPRAGRGAVVRLTKALSVLALVAGAVAFFLGQATSRAFTAFFFALVWGLLVANRGLFRLIARFMRARGYSARRFAVVGTGGDAREVAEAIAGHPEYGYQFAGFVLVDDGDPRSRGPLLGKLSRLETILQEHVIDEVVFALSRDRLDQLEDAVATCEELGVDYQISLEVLRFGQAKLRLGGIDDVPTLAYARTPSDSVALAVKRAFDMFVAGTVLFLLSPLLVGIAVAIRLDSRGPVFFRQRRVGLNGRQFTMLKFRSMHVDAEARLEALKAHNEMDGPVFKMRNDPRITRVGRFLRKTSLDEFPQFLNVLSGEMSVVGPRPPIPAEVRQYKAWQRRRLSMKPGITCIWQVSGRNDIDFDHWMELDLEYIDHWSLWRDFEICLRTIPAVLTARGAS